MSNSKCKRANVDVESPDDIVISGLSGRYPKSNNVAEFSSNLFNKVDMVDDEETRWLHTHPEIPRFSGKINDISKFDNQYFGIAVKQAECMDPQSRMLLEHSFEAVMDAGVSVKSMRGRNTGVVIGLCYNESESIFMYDTSSKEGYGLTGSARTMHSNRISFTLGVTGPSYTLDTACSSSLYALDCGYKLISSGECESVIVGASNLGLNPSLAFQFGRLGILSHNGKNCSFDENASGYTRAEAVCSVFLQKRSAAKRVYATLVHSKTNFDGYKEQGIVFPSSKMQKKLMQSFYHEIGLSPASSRIGYIEAHATGTKIGDPEECNTLDEVFCDGRTKPVLVGSVKSNMGHAETASGLCSLTKVVIALETQKIPPNIHFTVPKSVIPSLVEGRLKVVSETTDLPGDMVCINSFGFGGANAHALLQANPKVKVNKGIPTDDIPRLVVWSGRSEEAVNCILDSVTNQPLDAEYVALLQYAQLDSVPANLYRGYGVYTQSGNVNNATVASRDVQHFNGVKRPVVWMYSGMGSQWAGMGRDLMKIPIFNTAIEKCHKTLAVHGLNLKEIIKSSDATMFDNILHSFVGIAAVQIGLTDVLTALGLKPDHIIGHSVGELGCAYADGCMTAEEMILSAYSRGMASLESKVVQGSMAAVGMGFSELSKILPDGVEIACHNSAESCTISGPAGNIAKFVADLQKRSIFAKEVACSNIPYHSSFIAKMGPILLKKLKAVIKSDKKRSPKWISSSFPEARWNEPKSQISSAEYHTNNLLSPVLFEEASALLPKDAMIIEIAPHGLLQAIVKRSFPEAVNIPLTKRLHKNNDQFFVAALGCIYINGIDLQTPLLYPAVEFPVSRGTPMISPNIKWDHSQDHYVAKFDVDKMKGKAERKFTVSLDDPDFEFLSGHFIDGRCLFPATGFLFYVWQTYAMTRGLSHADISVEFEDVKFIRAMTLAAGITVEFNVFIHPATGRFEISEKSSLLVTGTVRQAEKSEFSMISNDKQADCVLPQRDFYKELRLRGYQYKGLFKSVVEASSDGLCGKIQWNYNWISFLDCLMQIQIIGQDTRSLALPTSIEKMVIDPAKLLKETELFDVENPVFDVHVCSNLKLIQSVGVQIKNLQASFVGRRRPKGVPVLEVYEFVPYTITDEITLSKAARVIVQLALENSPTKIVKAVEVGTGQTMLPDIFAALADLPLVTSSLTLLSDVAYDDDQIKTENTALSSHTDCYLIIVTGCLNNSEILETARSCLSESGYLVCREKIEMSVEAASLPSGFVQISSIVTHEEVLHVFRPHHNHTCQTAVEVRGDNTNYEWIDVLKSAMEKGPTVVVSQNEKHTGILGLVNCLRREPNGTLVSCMLIDDARAPKFSLDDPFYQKQLQHRLAVNIFKDGAWGSYRHLQAQQTLPLLPNQSHCYVNVLIKSDLSSLKWISGPFNYSRPKGELVKVQYAALNFKDIMLATDKISGEMFADNRLDSQCVLGLEYAGVTSSGKRVMGMKGSAALSTYVEADDVFTFECPPDWTLADAATVPIVYGTVYAAFFVTTKIQKGKSVLIHAGSGGIGLAAIRVAFAYGLEVFTTVSTAEKKQFLLTEFPQLKEKNIGNSRDTSFENLVMTQTNGKGVDYVLNSLAEDKLIASVRCLGKGGKFLEIGKFDMANDTKIGLGSFLNELSFHAVMVDRNFKASMEEKQRLAKMIADDIKSGIIKPLKANIFDASEVEQAFRLLASGKHVGKVLLKVRENEMDAATMPISVVPRVYCNSENSYIICGGLGGFGLELADWLVLRGCKKLVLSSSRGITKQYQSYRIKTWQSYGVQVAVNTSDITIKAGCEQLILDAMKLGPVGGIFNLAVVLKDGIFESLNSEKFKECMAPKADATKYLDEVSRKLCTNLQYFVVFSSVSCGRGNAGQSNYGMANSVMEKIMEQRSLSGLPAKAIQWGAVGEVGLVADMAEDKIDLEIGGTLQQRISSCLEELDFLMSSKDPVVSSMVVAEKRHNEAKGATILDIVLNIMGIRDVKTISMEMTLAELGMDSMSAVEVRQLLEREFELHLSPPELRAITLSKLVEASNKSMAKLKQNDCNELVEESIGNELLVKVSASSEMGSAVHLVIPGAEGVGGDNWVNLTELLVGDIHILQHKNSPVDSTFDAFVDSMVPSVWKLFEKSEQFNLIAHSFGTTIALKLANALEARGLRGKLLLIDGSPKFVKQYSLERIADGDLETIVLDGVIDFLAVDRAEFFEKLGTHKSLDEKVQIMTALQSRRRKYSSDAIKSAFMTISHNTRFIVQFDSSDFKKLENTQIHLARQKLSPLKKAIEEDYGLAELSEKPVDITLLEGSHSTILYSPDLKKLISKLF